MSDLANIFTQSQNSYTPIKRLFTEETSASRSKPRARSKEPHKSMRHYKANHNQNTTVLQPKSFAKRYIQKQDIKKEMNLYNQQILLAFIRKMFFIMGAVLLFNIFFTSSRQWMILANMMLALCLVDVNLGNDLLGNAYLLASKQIVKMVVYCINFYQFYLEMHSKSKESEEINVKILLISINAALNYTILTFCEPLVSLSSLNNYKCPYAGFLQTLKSQLIQFGMSLKALFFLRRPIILLNLIYWFFIVIYIVYNKSDWLLESLLTFETLSTFCFSTFLLYIYMYIVKKTNQAISIELLSLNKKTINLNILRLDDQNLNNKVIKNEALKYVWRNCEIIWDIELILHKYSINYDVVEDYLNTQLERIREIVFKTIRKLEYNRKYDGKKLGKISLILASLQKKYVQLRQAYRLAKHIKSRQYLFYIIEQIIQFEKYTNDFPINIKTLRQKNMKINQLIKAITQLNEISELKHSVRAFQVYVNQKIISTINKS